MKNFIFISIFVGTILGASVMVYAAEYTADLSLTVSEQYNDNLFLDHSNKVSDYITSIAPVLALSTRTVQSDIAINYSPTLFLYKDNSDNNNVSHQASILGHYRVTEGLTLGLSDTFLQTRQSSLVRAAVGAGPITSGQGQERITTNTLSGDLAYKLTGKITLLGNADYTYTDTQTGTGDVSTYSGGLGANYLFNERTTFRVKATYTFFHYTISGDATSNSYIAGVNYKLTPTIIADAFGGVVITRIDQPSSSDTGFTGGLSVTKTFERGTASLSFVQDVIAGFESSSPVRSQTVLLRYSAPVTASLDASISGFYSRYRPIGIAVSSGATINRNDTGGTADLTYRLLPWLSAIVSYTYINSDAQVDKSSSYINNVITAGLKLSKQAKF